MKSRPHTDKSDNPKKSFNETKTNSRKTLDERESITISSITLERRQQKLFEARKIFHNGHRHLKQLWDCALVGACKASPAFLLSADRQQEKISHLHVKILQPLRGTISRQKKLYFPLFLLLKPCHEKRQKKSSARVKSFDEGKLFGWRWHKFETGDSEKLLEQALNFLWDNLDYVMGLQLERTALKYFRAGFKERR